MKQRHPTSTLRLAAGAAILTLALLGLLGMASARPSEANGPDVVARRGDPFLSFLTMTIPAGNTSAEFSFDIVDDLLDEDDEDAVFEGFDGHVLSLQIPDRSGRYQFRSFS